MCVTEGQILLLCEFTRQQPADAAFFSRPGERAVCLPVSGRRVFVCVREFACSSLLLAARVPAGHSLGLPHTLQTHSG